MKLIPLTHGKFAQVDDEDFEKVNEFQWHSWWPRDKKRSTEIFYAIRNLRQREPGYIRGKRVKVKLHRWLMGVTDPKIFIDHKDHDGLNCQRSNMRLATNAQNQMNGSGWGSSKYMGVSKNKQAFESGRPSIWRATIKVNGKYKELGKYKTEEDAAKAYDKAAKEYHGEFANLNFKE